ncbi:MAG: hypothetical protein PF518_09025 [Spirochaetaceae bacterium]|jgi:response regulator RpfG family c-di-GMP phosphodiesterase|nr:hypothetical protein [Spirochaetaceae bacterium]
MPIIERKTLDRIKEDDILLYDAGNLIKAGQKAGNNASQLAKFSVSFITVISPTKEEKSRLFGRKIDQFLSNYIENKNHSRSGELRFRLRETLLSIDDPFIEQDQSYSIPGKRNYLSENDLLQKKIESLNFEQVAAGSSRLINTYKLKFSVDIITQFQSSSFSLKLKEQGKKEIPGHINRMSMNSNRLNSWYDESRFRTMGDSLVNQSIDIALMYLHTFTNINKKRIADEQPLSQARYDSSQRKAVDGLYQYKPEFILEATIGALLHNLGYAHQTVHKIISSKPLLNSDNSAHKDKIKKVQQSVNVVRHLLDREDISSISKMICTMQKDYPDGTGYPIPNENKYLYEFVRLFQIISFYDQMTNPVLTKIPFSRIDVIRYMIENSGEYKYTGDKYTNQPKFDSPLLEEFLNVLAPYEINEKVYLYEKGKHNNPIFVGKVVSYPDSYIPLISILKDEKNDKEYLDGSVFLHISSSSLYLKKEGKTERKVYPWISHLEIFDKKVDAGNLAEYEDHLFGKERILHKKFR